MSSSLNSGRVLLALDALTPDSLQALEDVPLAGSPEALILYRDAAGGVRAWLNVCPHAGRRLDYAPGRFLRGKTGELVCAAHGASFALEDGVCVAGPCRGQSLRAIPVRCVDGQVVLATGTAAADQ